MIDDVPTAKEIAKIALPRIAGLGFEEALDALVRAIPELAQSRDEIRRVYQRAGFALARSADLATTAAVQKIIAERIAAGEGAPTASAAIQALSKDFTPAYAETVVRNATNRAYNAGRMRQAAENPSIAGLEYHAIHDGDARPNHLALDGLRCRLDDPLVDRISPPNGHRCRCGWGVISYERAERNGWLDPATGELPDAVLPPGGGPDPGGTWGQRSDAVYHGG